MSVTFAEDCFEAEDPVDPDWASLDDDEFDARYPAEATGHYEGGWEAEPRFRVVTETVERAADALLVVADRFMCVGQSGTEHDPSEPATDEDSTPSHTSVTVDARRPMCGRTPASGSAMPWPPP